MKLSNVRVYLQSGQELFYAVGGKLLDKTGKEMVPPIEVIDIAYSPILRETKVYFSNKHKLVYRGMDVSFEGGEGVVAGLFRRVKEAFMGSEGVMPPGRTGGE